MGEQRSIAELRDVLRQQLPLLKERYGVASLGLFGSDLHYQAGPGSDLSNLLGVRVDLVMPEALKPAVGQRVLAEVEPI